METEVGEVMRVSEVMRLSEVWSERVVEFFSKLASEEGGNSVLDYYTRICKCYQTSPL